MSREIFINSERRCQVSFESVGPWYHLYTSGKTTGVILRDDDDFKYCMNLLARCCKEHPELIIVAFAIMDNHIHIVLSGDKAMIERMFAVFRRRLSRYLYSRYSASLPDTFSATAKEITDLKTLRNTIAYVHRNGYVVHSGYTPFTYPWGSGFSYFNIVPVTKELSLMTIDEQRRLLKGRVSPVMSDALLTDNGCVVPTFFCRVRLGMSMFRDAHHYYSQVSKSVESYAEIASDIDDGEFLTDQELFLELYKILKNDYSGLAVKDLSSAQKLDLARLLRFRFKSSNGQIRRLLNISQYDINAIFPKSVNN